MQPTLNVSSPIQVHPTSNQTPGRVNVHQHLATSIPLLQQHDIGGNVNGRDSNSNGQLPVTAHVDTEAAGMFLIQPRTGNSNANDYRSGRNELRIPHSGFQQDTTQLTSAQRNEKEALVLSLKSLIRTLSWSVKQHPTQTTTVPYIDTLSATASTVLTSLKWLLFKRIEKPLKNLRIQQLFERGVAATIVSVKCDCDYSTFRNLSATLASYFDISEHIISSSSSPVSSRICFHPDFARTQCGSSGVDNLSISFTCLSDIMDFIGVRDEDDFEKVLSTEVQTRTENLLQIMGSLLINSMPNNESTTSSSCGARSSLSTSNEKSSKSKNVTERMSIFVGSAPLQPASEENRSTQQLATSTHTFNTYKFEQVCRHFSEEKMCYNTQWFASSNLASYAKPMRRGLQQDPDNSKYFVLNWRQTKPPSTVKWSRDAQTFGSSFPGRIELSLPAVFTSSRSNVSALSSLLDNNIEDVLQQRIIMHKCRNPSNFS